MKKLYKVLVCILPAVLFFSYHPLIHFGESESMNFEISLPLIWLIVFDLVVGILTIRKREFWQGIKKHWIWLLFPMWISLSVAWSLNPVRGILTVGIVWLICFAVYGFYLLRGLFDARFRVVFWRVFFGSTIVICIWCFLQCILDLMGVGREYTLMCAGCTYSMFGFPHPNGFAIEPQFMGNMLLAPVIIISARILAVACPSDTLRVVLAKSLCSEKHGTAKTLALAFVISATLFLTFSRGAIYAAMVGLVFMSAFVVARRRIKKGEIVKRVGMMWGIVVLAFAFILNLQGIMSAVSPTNDTYQDGVAKVLNHLSLGVVDIRGGSSEDDGALEEAETNDAEENGAEEAVFDGYVAESTDARLYLSNAAMQVWQNDFTTMIFGIGLGGAGQALMDNGFTLTSKEIVQNQYVSLLLETGIVGILLFVLTIVLALRVVWTKCTKSIPMILPLMVAYGVSLCFFAGLANALQIYLLIGLLIVMGVGGHGTAIDVNK